MYTFLRFGNVLPLLLFATTAATAQNLLENPGFDSGLDGWSASTTAEWSASVGFTGPSLHLPSSAATASQCVGAGKGDTYVATSRVYAHCVGARFYVFWATTEDCDDTGAFPDAPFAVSTSPDEWQLLTIVAQSPHSAKYASVMLFGGGCTDGVYFDDVTIKNDFIMLNGFE